MALTLIAELKVKCADCGHEFSHEGQSDHCCATPVNYEPAQSGQNPVGEPPIPVVAAVVEPLNPIPGPAGDQPMLAVTLEEAMEELRQRRITPEVEKMGTLFVKSKLKSSADGKTALLKTCRKVLLTIIFKKLLILVINSNIFFM